MRLDCGATNSPQVGAGIVLLYALLVLLAVGYAVNSQWSDVRSAISTLKWQAVVLSLVACLAGSTTSLMAWRAVLADEGYRLSPIAAGRINTEALRPKFTIDEKAIQRSIAAGINSRVQQDIARARDFQAYGRNPMGWHGVPPH